MVISTFFEGFLVGGMADSNDCLSDDILDNLLLMASGMLRIIHGGWLLLWLMY